MLPQWTEFRFDKKKQEFGMRLVTTLKTTWDHERSFGDSPEEDSEEAILSYTFAQKLELSSYSKISNSGTNGPRYPFFERIDPENITIHNKLVFTRLFGSPEPWKRNTNSINFLQDFWLLFPIPHSTIPARVLHHRCDPRNIKTYW